MAHHTKNVYFSDPKIWELIKKNAHSQELSIGDYLTKLVNEDIYKRLNKLN